MTVYGGKGKIELGLDRGVNSGYKRSFEMHLSEDESLLSNQPTLLPALLAVSAQTYGHPENHFMGGIEKSKHDSLALTSLHQ
ncbi:MAG: hypothetical protein ABSB22_02165 [Thermodesulfobacteriota bacterium]|jgi:hypothetical protein